MEEQGFDVEKGEDMQPLALLGSHTLKLDDKGRFIIPAKLRDAFADARRKLDERGKH